MPSTKGPVGRKGGCCASNGPAACCVRRCDFVKEETLTAFNKLSNNSLPCTEPVEFPGPSAANDSNLGDCVALSRDGSVLVASKAFYDSVAFTNVGAVYVFERPVKFGACVRDEKKYALRQILTAPISDQTNNLDFGFSLAVSADGNRIVVGAPCFNAPSAQDCDAVYVFDRFASRCDCIPQWQLVQKIKAQKFVFNEDECDCDVVEDFDAILFGYLLSLSENGRVLVVGAPDELFAVSVNGAGSAVYIYESKCNSFGVCASNCEGPFKFEQRITNDQFNAVSNPQLVNPFVPSALTVDETGERIAIAAYVATVSQLSQVGVVQIYRRKHHESEWLFAQRLEPRNPSQNLNFGIALAMTANGRYLAVETPSQRSMFPKPDAKGFVTMFREVCQDRCGVIYVQDGAEILTNTAAKEFDSGFFGQTLAISDDGCLLAVGWEESTVSQIQFSGKIDIYERDCTGVNNNLNRASYSLKQQLFAESQGNNQRFGLTVAMSGDATTLVAGNRASVETFVSAPKKK